MAGRRGAGVWIGIGLALGAAGLLAWALLRAQSLPEGPLPVAFDREACARCRMLVSEPAFAAQLQTADGRILVFDDPAELLLTVAEQKPEVHAAWFHHLREERWIPGDRVVFVPVDTSPMGFGLGAVERGEEPDAMSWDEALARARAIEAERSR